MNEYVMFGFSHFFGDLFDIITDRGGQLTRVVLNVPETPFPGRLSLKERLGRLPYPVTIENFDEFKPRPAPFSGEIYMIGFSRRIMAPLLGDIKRRFNLFFSPLIHSRAILQYGALADQGAIVNAGAIIGSWAKVGRHTIVNRGANVGHDCEIGDYCFLSPGATLCSHVKLGENVLVGANATILPDVQVGADAVIGAGAVVLDDVPSGVMVVGVPAAIKRTETDQC